MTNQNSKSESTQRRFSQKQYDMLKRCSQNRDMTEWNEWRKKHPDKDILLEGAPLGECYLEGVHLDLKGGHLINQDGTIDNSKKVCSKVFLKGAHFNHAHLENAALMDSHLEEANLSFAHLEGAGVSYAHLNGAVFQHAKVNSSTSFWECKVNRYCKNNKFTNFSGVALDNASIDPTTKQLLEYNIRRKNWNEWYKEHWVLRWPVRGFFGISDYGLRTWRIIGMFFILAGAFAAIYANCACWFPRALFVI